MSLKQSRRGVSLSRPVYDAIAAAADLHGMSMSELVTCWARAHLAVPETHHMAEGARRRAVVGRIIAKRNRANGWLTSREAR